MSNPLYEALVDATAALAGAESAYRMYARRHPSVGKAPPDPFFTTRSSDMGKAVQRARKALRDFDQPKKETNHENK